jgi:hypothetical protein
MEDEVSKDRKKGEEGRIGEGKNSKAGNERKKIRKER